MLQPTPLSKVYGHGHIKKFWLMQNQKETESKAVLASSTSRNAGNTGLGHESKQGSQFSVGNSSTRTLTSPSGLPVRPLVSSPACFNMAMAMARHTSLATCAESLSPSSRMEQSPSLARSPSLSTSASTSKEENCYSPADGDCMLLKSPYREDANSVSTSQWGSSFGHRDKLAGDFRSPLTSKEGGFDNKNDCSPPSKDLQQNSTSLQEGYQHVKISDDASSKKCSSGPSKCSLGFFSELETVAPFAVPFQLPEKYFLEAEVKPFDGEPSKVGTHIVSSGNTRLGKSAVPSILNCGPGRRELSGVVEGEASSTILRTCAVCGTSKTPLWRSGPLGPKSLCNACGIRFKKARRGSSEGMDCPVTSLASPSAKTALKPVKRKQDTPFLNVDTQVSKPQVFGAPTNGLATQVVKKRRWSQLIRKGECVTQNCEVTGSSNESSLTWNLHSPSAVSSPSVSHFERLSIDENSTALDMVAGKDEEEAAVLLMYMSWGLVFA